MSETKTTLYTGSGKELDDLGYVYGTRKREPEESDQSYRQAVVDHIGKPVSTLAPLSDEAGEAVKRIVDQNPRRSRIDSTDECESCQ